MMQRLQLDEKTSFPSIWVHTARSACGSYYDQRDEHDKNNAMCSSTLFSLKTMVELWASVKKFQLVSLKKRQLPQNDYYSHNMSTTDVYFKYNDVSYVVFANIVTSAFFASRWHRKVKKIYCYVLSCNENDDVWWHDATTINNHNSQKFEYRGEPQIQDARAVNLSATFHKWRRDFWQYKRTPEHEFDYILFLLLLNKNNTLESGK